MIVHACIMSSLLWPAISPNVLRLHENMRLTMHPEDQQFAIWLRRLARGELNENDIVSLPSALLCPSNSLTELIQHVYADLGHHLDDTYFAQRCILCP